MTTVLLSFTLLSAAAAGLLIAGIACLYASHQRQRRIHWQNECARIQREYRTRMALAGDQEASPCA